jgi:hypothetical protein
MDASPRRFGPTGEAPDAVLDGLGPEVNHFHLRSGVLHAGNEMAQHELCLTLAFDPGTGIQCEHLHGILLCTA